MSKIKTPPRMIKPRMLPPRPGAGAPSIVMQVRGYLSRLPYSLPFPVDAQEFYFSCLPPMVREWWREGSFTNELTPSQTTNLINSVMIEHENIPLHFSLASAETYNEGLYQSLRGHKYVFWIRLPYRVPRMRMDESPMWVPIDNPYREALTQWWTAAHEQELDSDKIIDELSTYSSKMIAAAAVKITWPELLNFFTLSVSTISLTHAERTQLVDEALAIVSRERREHITNQLSKAVMLPRSGDREPLAAWVGFNNEER